MRSIEAAGLSAGYLGAPVVRDLDLHVGKGEVVALLGANGAGKTTTLLTLSGDLPAIKGEVRLHGRPTAAPLHARAARGLSLVTEERSVFKGLTAKENLRVAGVHEERVLDLFPELRSRMNVRAGLLSGGEQQMLTLGRALARDPDVLLADELSLGLAPLVVDRLLAAVRDAADRGVAVLLVEQHVTKVLAIADRVYLLRRGVLELTCTAAEAADRMAEIEKSYIGR